MKNRLLIFLVITLGFIISCSKRNVSDLPLNKFYGQIYKNGVLLPNDELNLVKAFYVINGERKYGIDSTICFMPTYPDAPAINIIDTNLSILGSIRISDYASRRQEDDDPICKRYKVNTWYFEFPDGDIDTLYVEVRDKDLSRKKAEANPCYCYRPFTVVKYNGKDAEINKELNLMKPVYMLHK